ncbi:hypothetical protein BJ165DRAFT_1340332, partial [Panaeolus papilionaceus]
GGGIGGLTAAVALSHSKTDQDIDIDVYEAAPKLTQVGAEISIWPRAWDVLRSFDLGEELLQRLPEEQRLKAREGSTGIGFSFRKSDQKYGEDFCDLEVTGRLHVSGITSFHRADVQDVLVQHISPRVNIHLSHRLREYRETKGVILLEFQDGQRASCDFLIGADGLKSAVRKNLLGFETDPKIGQIDFPEWSGTYAYRSLIKSDIIREINPYHRALTKPMVHIVTYPVLKGTYLNALPFFTEVGREGTKLDEPEVVQVKPEEVSTKFVGWEDEVMTIVQNMTNPSRWAIQTVGPLDSYVSESGRVVLVGDAAHAMPTHLGNGAGQAIEDAFILATLLAESNKRGEIDVARIAKVYDHIRQPFANSVLTASKNQGLFYEFMTPDFQDVKEGDLVAKERLEELGVRIQEK